MPLEIGKVNSPLGDWTFAHFSPRADDPLAQTLASAWYFDGMLAHRRERVFPKGVHGLILQLDEPHRRPDGSPFPPCTTASRPARSSSTHLRSERA